MTTTVVKTIGSSSDYTSLQAWEDACPPDLRAGTGTDQIWQGQCAAELFTTSTVTPLLSISGTLTDSGHYLELTTQAGASFRDNASVRTNALRYDTGNGAAISSSRAYGQCIGSSVDYTRISNLQFQNIASHGLPIVMSLGGGGTPNCDINNCIIEGAYGFASGSQGVVNLYGSGQVIRNSLVVMRGDAQGSIANIQNGAKAYNCVFACVTSVTTPPTEAICGAYAATTFVNCGFFGCTAVWGGGSTPTFTTCYTDVASPPTGCTTTAYSTSSGAKFVNIASGLYDYRIQSGSSLIDVGTTDSTNAAVDISGVSRPQGSAYDVGPWEYKAASGAVLSRGRLVNRERMGSAYSRGNMVN